MNFAGAKIIDFTGAVVEGGHYLRFDSAVVNALRGVHENKIAIVCDCGFGFRDPAPYVVTDHLNFTGDNPLIGPNDPSGERFVVVNNIYVTDAHDMLVPKSAFGQLNKGIACGLKPGLIPDAEELALIYELGAHFYCYNLVPTMLIAAHAGWKVLGLALPELENNEKNKSKLKNIKTLLQELTQRNS